MDDLMSLANGQKAALVILNFLQADCNVKDAEYNEALVSLSEDLNRDINFNGPCSEGYEDDGAIECDGHQSSCGPLFLDGLEPSVERHWPGNREEAADLEEVAAGLREIADRLEHSVVEQATQNLCRNILSSPFKLWKDILSREVERAMKQGVCLEHLPQERVIIALSLTLVKGVSRRAPQHLRDLFDTALQYVSPQGAR